MPFQFHTIGLIGTHSNPLVAETIARTSELLHSWQRSVWIETTTARALPHTPHAIGDLETLAQHCDLVIAVGGDGNLLNAARHLSLHKVPVLGINRGQLGFLTDVSPDQIDSMLRPILEGAYSESQRFLLQGQVYRNGKLIAQGNALNDIVLFPGDIAQLIEFELRIDNQFVYSQRSDGLIISTPTGSTAYALSAGGPIIEPDLQAMVLVPKLPHSLTSRPLVIDAKRIVSLHIPDYNKLAPRLSFDGQEHVSLEIQDEVRIQQQAQPLRLIHPKGYDYYHTLRTKLHWGTQLIPLNKRV